MRFLVIGLGSMGKRRLRNLLHQRIAKKNIAGFDISAKRAQAVTTETGISTFTDFKTALKVFKPEAFIISTPPNLHKEYFLYAAKHNLHFFVEVTTTDDGYKELKKLVPKMTAVAAPSCTYRFFTPIKELRRIVSSGEVGRVQAFTHHFGQYLPDWHPWEDYRQFYVSQPETSVGREMVPFELQWLQWVLGEKIEEMQGFRAKCSDLELSIPDTYAVTVRGQSIVGTVLVDVISRAPFRTLRILGSEGVVEWEWMKQTIRVYSSTTKKWKTITVKNGVKSKGYTTSTEDMYQDEMGAFIKAIKGTKKYPYTFGEDQHTLTLLNQMESARERLW